MFVFVQKREVFRGFGEWVPQFGWESEVERGFLLVGGRANSAVGCFLFPSRALFVELLGLALPHSGDELAVKLLVGPPSSLLLPDRKSVV